MQVKLILSYLAMVHADLDALTGKYEGASQEIVNLEEALCITWEEDR